MNRTTIISSRLAVCLAASVTLMAATRSVAASLTYSNGDLLLGFRKTGAANDYVVNLGPSSNYPAVGAPFTLSVGNLGADLSSAGLFGAGWNTDSTVSWSVSGATGLAGANGEPARTLFATRAESPIGTLATAWDTNTSTGQSAPDSKMRSMGTAIIGLTSTLNTNVGAIQSAGSANSYASFHDGVNSFAYFPGGIEGNFGAGASGTALDLFRMRTTSLANVGPGDYVGRFTIDNSGQLTFTPAAIPEPASLSILALAFAGFFIRRRRSS